MNTRTFFVLLLLIKGFSMSAAVVDKDGKVTEPVLNILKTLGISHDGTLNDIVAKTQKGDTALLRPAGLERWEMGDKFEANKDALMPYIKELGMVDELLPTQQAYDYAAVLGALTPRMILRVHHLKNMLSKVTVPSCLALVSDRPLEKERERYEDIQDTIGLLVRDTESFKKAHADLKTEADFMRSLVGQVHKEAPTFPVVDVINAPMKQQGDKVVRPTTNDTFAAWLEKKPTTGSVLVISNQPFVGWQTAVARTYLPKDFVVEGVGAAVGAGQTISLYLDTLARWLYQEHQRKAS